MKEKIKNLIKILENSDSKDFKDFCSTLQGIDGEFGLAELFESFAPHFWEQKKDESIENQFIECWIAILRECFFCASAIRKIGIEKFEIRLSIFLDTIEKYADVEKTVEKLYSDKLENEEEFELAVFHVCFKKSESDESKIWLEKSKEILQKTQGLKEILNLEKEIFFGSYIVNDNSLFSIMKAFKTEWSPYEESALDLYESFVLIINFFHLDVNNLYENMERYCIRYIFLQWLEIQFPEKKEALQQGQKDCREKIVNFYEKSSQAKEPSAKKLFNVCKVIIDPENKVEPYKHLLALIHVTSRWLGYYVILQGNDKEDYKKYDQLYSLVRKMVNEDLIKEAEIYLHGILTFPNLMENKEGVFLEAKQEYITFINKFQPKEKTEQFQQLEKELCDWSSFSYKGLEQFKKLVLTYHLEGMFIFIALEMPPKEFFKSIELYGFSYMLNYDSEEKFLHVWNKIKNDYLEKLKGYVHMGQSGCICVDPRFQDDILFSFYSEISKSINQKDISEEYVNDTISLSGLQNMGINPKEYLLLSRFFGAQVFLEGIKNQFSIDKIIKATSVLEEVKQLLEAFEELNNTGNEEKCAKVLDTYLQDEILVHMIKNVFLTTEELEDKKYISGTYIRNERLVFFSSEKEKQENEKPQRCFII